MLRTPFLLLCLACLAPAMSHASTSLSNTPATQLQLAHLLKDHKPDLYYCQTGIYDDLGNLDGDFAPPSHGRVTSAAWDLGDGRYLYAYQLSNPNYLEGDTGFFGNWDVAISGTSGYLSIPLRQLHITPLDYDGDEQLDTSFYLSDHACNSEFAEGNDCGPLTGAFSVFTTGTDPCAKSWSDYYVWDEDGPDAIVEALEGRAGDANHAHFAVRYSPGVCCHGIFRSTPIFGFVTDAPPLFADGHYLDGTSSSIRLVAPAPRALLVHGFCDDTTIWDTYEEVLSDSGFIVDRLPYGTTDFSERPSSYVDELRARLDAMKAGHITVIAHSMGGLIARQYMQEQTEHGRPNKIAKLITLGTPHHGSDFGTTVVGLYFSILAGTTAAMPEALDDLLAKLKDHSNCLVDPRSLGAAFDMLPGSQFLNRLNYGSNRELDDPEGSFGWNLHEDETTLPEGTPISAIAGTFSICANGYLMDVIWGRGPDYVANDAIVAAGSSFMANPEVSRNFDSDLLVGSRVTHLENSFLTCGATYQSSTDLAKRLTEEILHSGAGGGGAPLTRLSRSAAPASIAAAQRDSMRAAPAVVDTVPAGQIGEKHVVLPATTGVDILLLSQDAILSLETPSNVIITVDDTSTAAGIFSLGTPGSGFEGFHIDNPEPGTWSVHVDATASVIKQAYAILPSYASSNVARISVTQSPVYGSDSIRVRASLTSSGSPSPEASWTCIVTLPDESTAAVSLYDDGVHGDSLLGDGIFGAAVASSAGIGDYQFTGVASIPSGESFVAGTVGEVARFADLAIDSLDVYLSRNVVTEGDSVSAFATVHNLGSDALLDVVVGIVDEDTFEELGTDTVDIAAGGSTTVQFPWHVALPDTHHLRAFINPHSEPSEVYLSNNSAVRRVILGYPVGVGEPIARSRQLWFAAPHPNPSHGSVTMAFSLPSVANAVLEVFDVLGRRVRSWEWRSLAAGPHTVEWNGVRDDGQRVGPGVFLCRLRTGEHTLSQKIIVR